MYWIYYAIGILCFLGYSQSKPNGAPKDSCFYMTPRHIHPHTYRKVFPTRAMGLYNITTSADIFRPDRPIRVTLWGPPFKGFMMVAAEEGAKDWPTGIFYSDDGSAKRESCLGRGDTITHQNNSYKDSVSMLWYGPENMMSEQIQFIATVVVNLTMYYTNIKSGFIRLDPSLHAAQAGGENGPLPATMDPWLAGNSATQAPTNWWNRGQGGTGGAAGILGSLLGGNTWNNGQSGTSWGSGNSWNNGRPGGGSSWNTGGSGGSSSWSSGTGTGTGTGTGSSWSGSGGNTGSNTWSSGSDWQQWGDGSVTSRTTWSGQSAGSSAGSSWGSSGTGSNSWGTGGTGTGTGSSGNTWGNSWGSSSGSSWGSSAPGSSGTNNSSSGQAGGSSIWTWNSGPVTKAPPTTTTTKAPAAANTSAWSVDTLLNLLQQLLGGYQNTPNQTRP